MIATTVPLPTQRYTTKVSALTHVKQCDCFAALQCAMPEHGRFPRENGSMICSDPVVQGSGGEVHDDRILNRHIAHSADEDAFDPII